MILLDTHVLVWLRIDPKRLSKPAASAIGRAERAGRVAVASISLWELARMGQQGQLGGGTVQTCIERLIERLAVLPLTPEIAAQAVQFGPSYPRDPADRQIGATAVAHGLTLLTADERIRSSGLVRTLW